jgi:hypothetical protein
MRGILLLEDIEGGYGTIFKKGEVYPEDGQDQKFNEDGTFTICQGMGMYFEVKEDQYVEVVGGNNDRWYNKKALKGNLELLEFVMEVENLLDEGFNSVSIVSRLFDKYEVNKRDKK